MENMMEDCQKNLVMKIANEGTDNASVALYQLTGRKIDMAVKLADIIPTTNLSKIAEVVGETVVSSYALLQDVLLGAVFIMVPKTDAKMLIDLLEKKRIGSTKYIDDMAFSAIKETNNIIGNAYITAFSRSTGMTILPSIPRVVYTKMFNLSAMMVESIGKNVDRVFVIVTKFKIAPNVKGLFAMVIAFEYIESVLKATKKRRR